MQKYLKGLAVRLVTLVFIVLVLTAVLNIVTGQTQNYWAFLVAAWVCAPVFEYISPSVKG